MTDTQEGLLKLKSFTKNYDTKYTQDMGFRKHNEIQLHWQNKLLWLLYARSLQIIINKSMNIFGTTCQHRSVHYLIIWYDRELQ